VTRVKVFAGACGFTTVIKVQALDMMYVSIQIISACNLVREMNQDLSEVDCSHGVLGTILDSLVYRSAHRRLKQHTECPIPVAIIKAIQVEIGAALPKDVSIHIEKLD
jgi:hypothetical protein